MSDWEKANELMENLINIYSPKLTQDEVYMLKSHMLSGKNMRTTLFKVYKTLFIINILVNMKDDSKIFSEGAHEVKL